MKIILEDDGSAGLAPRTIRSAIPFILLQETGALVIMSSAENDQGPRLRVRPPENATDCMIEDRPKLGSLESVETADTSARSVSCAPHESNGHFGPEWFWDQNRPAAILARRQMAIDHKKLPFARPR